MSLSLNDIQNALPRVHQYIQPTSLRRSEKLENELKFPGQIFLKCEFEQPTGSFKVRGAFNVLSQLTDEEKSKGVVTRSSGNFAQAVAYAAHQLGIQATIVMPANAPKTKREGTEKYGPEIITSGNKHEEGELVVKDLVNKRGLVPMHPYNNYRTMAGQGTAALEILQQLPGVNHFFCPVGGGGLLSGCATAFKETNPSIATHGVEPAGAGDYFASRQSGKLQTWEKIDTIADGLRASSVGVLNYPILNKYVDEVTLVSDEEIKAAMKWLFEKMQIIAEPSGAVALAGFLKTHKNIRGNVVILISGKNVDQENFQSWIKS